MNLNLVVGKRYQFTYQVIDLNLGFNPYVDKVVTGIYMGAEVVIATHIRQGGAHEVVLSCHLMPGQEPAKFLLSAVQDAKEA